MKRSNIILALIVTGLIVIAGCSSGNMNYEGSSDGSSDGMSSNGKLIKFYKSPNCGCCEGHASVLRQEGYSVEVIPVQNIAEVKARYDIPQSMMSCHTAVVDGYFVEGHVPVEAINKLLEEKPDVDGIALPRMPAGSAGMPGVKKAPFVIYSLKNGVSTEFMTI